jgi:hypothetical protein
MRPDRRRRIVGLEGTHHECADDSHGTGSWPAFRGIEPPPSSTPPVRTPRPRRAVRFPPHPDPPTDADLDSVSRTADRHGLDPELPLIEIGWWVTKERAWHSAEI